MEINVVPPKAIKKKEMEADDGYVDDGNEKKMMLRLAMQ